MKDTKKKWVIILVLLLALSSCSKKEEAVSPPATEEKPAETSTGFSFSKDEDLHLFTKEGRVFIQGEETKEVLWDQKKLQTTDVQEKIYEQAGLSYSLNKGVLTLYDNQETTALAENILGSAIYEDKLLYAQEKGIYLLHFTRKIPQLIKENVPGAPAFQIKDFMLLEGGKYFLYYNEEASVTEIYLSESLEHVMSFDGKVSAASWVSDTFLFEDQENLNRIGFYQISTEEVSKFTLTTKDEKVLFSPTFDEHGMVRFISEKDGILALNKLDVQTQMVKKINMMKREDLLKEEVVDGVHVFLFKSYFFYSYDDNAYHFYALEADRLNFFEEQIFVAKDLELKVIEKDSYKSYSLMGKPIESLGIAGAYYYTYEKDGKQWLDRIKLDH